MKYEISCRTCFWCRAKSGSRDYVCMNPDNDLFQRKMSYDISDESWKKQIPKVYLVPPVVRMEFVCVHYLAENDTDYIEGKVMSKKQFKADQKRKQQETDKAKDEKKKVNHE